MDVHLMDSLVPSSVMATSAALFTQLHCQIHSRSGKTHLPNEVGMNRDAEASRAPSAPAGGAP